MIRTTSAKVGSAIFTNGYLECITKHALIIIVIAVVAFNVSFFILLIYTCMRLFLVQFSYMKVNMINKIKKSKYTYIITMIS